MLAGVELDEVREYALRLAFKMDIRATSWSSVINYTNGVVKREIYNQLGEKFLPSLSSLYLFLFQNSSVVVGNGVDLSGKGLIIVKSMFSRHAVAFEDGYIFDPNFFEPVRGWEEWVRRATAFYGERLELDAIHRY